MMNNKLFPESEKSTFPYWFAHWKAYNKVAMEWGVWKLKYLFHDIEKPFLRLFLPYEKVKAFHRKHNRHHINYPDKAKIDWMALAIDWECSYHTKLAQPFNAWSYAHYYMDKKPRYKSLIKYNLLPILKAMKKDKPFNRDEQYEVDR